MLIEIKCKETLFLSLKYLYESNLQQHSESQNPCGKAEALIFMFIVFIIIAHSK